MNRVKPFAIGVAAALALLLPRSAVAAAPTNASNPAPLVLATTGWTTYHHDNSRQASIPPRPPSPHRHPQLSLIIRSA